MAVTSIRNETASQLTLISAEGERLVLAPLQQKPFDGGAAFDFTRAEREGKVSLLEEEPSKLGEQIIGALFAGGIWLGGAAFLISNADPYISVTQPVWRGIVWSTAAAILLVVLAVMIIRGTNSASLVARFATQGAALAVILAIGLGLPAATIYFFGGGRELLAEPASRPLALFGRLIQLAFIATASLLPVLLFFLFDRFQLGTLRKRLYANLFRLDPTVSTIGEIDAKYGSQIGEAYGSDNQGRGRLAPGSRWPVLVCAIVITIGWIVALAPVGDDFAPQDRHEALAILLPQPTALVFGFLGVYFFSLRLIAIRYARGDLKPKAYSYIMVRVLIVAVLSWVLHAIFGGESVVMLVLAFLFGVTPDEFFTFLKEKFRGTVPARVIPESTRLPLTDLEGIDLYDRGRLESEGIVNIEGLAHHELFDLIIETRLPVPRLIDWIDQAILHLHFTGGSDTTARVVLRNYGIRTATDLLRAWEAVEARGDAEFKAFKTLLGSEKAPYPLEVARDALLDDEWIRTVRYWRDDVQRDPVEVDAFPSTVEALEQWADRQLDNMRYGQALSALERSLQIKDTAGARRKIAHILATSPVPQYRDREKARQHAARAFDLASDDYWGIAALIDIYVAMEEYGEARRICVAALDRVSKSGGDKTRKAETQRLEELRDELTVRIARQEVPSSSAARPVLGAVTPSG